MTRKWKSYRSGPPVSFKGFERFATLEYVLRTLNQLRGGRTRLGSITFKGEFAHESALYARLVETLDECAIEKLVATLSSCRCAFTSTGLAVARFRLGELTREDVDILTDVIPGLMTWHLRDMLPPASAPGFRESLLTLAACDMSVSLYAVSDDDLSFELFPGICDSDKVALVKALRSIYESKCKNDMNYEVHNEFFTWRNWFDIARSVLESEQVAQALSCSFIRTDMHQILTCVAKYTLPGKDAVF